MTYVLSDIHGQMRRFKSVMKEINLQPNDTLFVLGDVIDRNPDGIRILRQLMAMPNAEMLLGNHEYMMLDALYYLHDEYEFGWQFKQEQRLNLWYQNGGYVTHQYLKHIKKTLRSEIFEYLNKLPLNKKITVGGKQYILVHAAPGKIFESQRRHSNYEDKKMFALWHRFRGVEEYPCEETVIFGHTATYHYQHCYSPMKIWHGKGLIGIDCGAAYPDGKDPWSYYRGCLACLRLDDMKEFYSEEIEAEDYGEVK